MQHPIVVLHGWEHNKTYWTAFAAQFADREVILLDLPGFGSEPLINASWGVSEYTQWVDAQIRERNLAQVVLIGHSLGGRIAAYLASQNPPWLAKLVLYGAPVLYRPTRWLQLRILAAKLLKPFVPARYKRTINSELADADEKGSGAIFRRVVGFDQTESLGRITVPTLLVWGEKDESVPLPIARETQTLIGGSQLVILPKVGHTAHLENPTLFYGTISRFIDAV